MGENKRIGEHAQTGADKRSGERLEDLDYRERGGVMCTWCSWSKWKRISYFIFTGGWWLVCSCEELEKIAAKVEDVEQMTGQLFLTVPGLTHDMSHRVAKYVRDYVMGEG